MCVNHGRTNHDRYTWTFVIRTFLWTFFSRTIPPENLSTSPQHIRLENLPAPKHPLKILPQHSPPNLRPYQLSVTASGLFVTHCLYQSQTSAPSLNVEPGLGPCDHRVRVEGPWDHKVELVWTALGVGSVSWWVRLGHVTRDPWTYKLDGSCLHTLPLLRLTDSWTHSAASRHSTASHAYMPHIRIYIDEGLVPSDPIAQTSNEIK